MQRDEGFQEVMERGEDLLGSGARQNELLAHPSTGGSQQVMSEGKDLKKLKRKG